MIHGATQPSLCGRAAAGSPLVDSSAAGPPSFFDSSALISFAMYWIRPSNYCM